MSKEKSQWPDPEGLSHKEIMEKLHAEGVDTVDKLVEKLLENRKLNFPRKPQSDAFPGRILAHPEIRPKALKPITHQPPKIPLYVDGVDIDPKDISRYNGRPLEFVVAKQRGDELALFASTSTPISDHMKAAHTSAWMSSLGKTGIGLERGKAIDTLAVDLVWDPSNVQMFQDIDYQSNWTWCGGGEYIPDLRQVSRDCTLWWCNGDWNDQISSMAATITWVAYYWDIYGQGSVLWQQPAQYFPDLRLFGWNDKISSVWNTGNQ